MESAVTPPPPPGFEVESTPPPPSGFEVQTGAKATPAPQTPEEKGTMLMRAFNTAKAMPLPMLGGLGFGALGSFVGPWGTVGGTMVGSGLGEKANQWLGITKPSGLDVAISTLAPGVAKAAKPMLTGVANAAVKTSGTREFVSEAASNVLGKWLGPRIPSAQLYQQASQLGQIIPAAQTGDVVRDIVKAEIKRAPTEIRGAI